MADTCLTAPTLTEVSNCYNTLSITQRITLPSTPSNVSITLKQRLLCSTHRVPHIWSAHVQDSSSLARSTEAMYPPQLIAKIFDPVFFDSYDAEYADPFIVRDLSVLCEVEAYQCLECLQGNRVPWFYGHFVAPLLLVPPNTAENVCHRHKDAIIDAAHLSMRCQLDNDLDMVMVDFEGVDFQEPDTSG